MAHPRANTNRVLELIAEGLLDKDVILQAALEFLSDSEVELMCRKNDIFLEYADDWYCEECDGGPFGEDDDVCPDCNGEGT